MPGIIESIFLKELDSIGKDEIVWAAKNDYDLCGFILQKYGLLLLPVKMMSNGYKVSYSDLMDVLKENRKDLYSTVHSNPHVGGWVHRVIANINARIL